VEKSKFFMAKVLAIVLIFGMTFAGCTTTHYGVAISNVPNVRTVSIRNAGASSWDYSIQADNLQNINRSRFSDRVDIKVVDASGIVYSRHNVPFDEAAFFETRERHIGLGTSSVVTAILLAAAAGILLFGFPGGE
jgi:hypothetical protein